MEKGHKAHDDTVGFTLPNPWILSTRAWLQLSKTIKLYMDSFCLWTDGIFWDRTNNSSVVSWSFLTCLKLQAGTKRTFVFYRQVKRSVFTADTLDRWKQSQHKQLSLTQSAFGRDKRIYKHVTQIDLSTQQQTRANDRKMPGPTGDWSQCTKTLYYDFISIPNIFEYSCCVHLFKDSSVSSFPRIVPKIHLEILRSCL